MFVGFDVNSWDPHVVWLWRYSNLRFAGFYLAHAADGYRSDWTPHWHDMRDLGWGLVPFWLAFGSATVVAQLPRADGTAHGNRAVERALAENVEKGATIYLDIEAPVLTPRNIATDAYIQNWCAAVVTGGFRPGIYCSRLDASILLGSRFRSANPTLFPFSIADNTRARWDERQWRLTPALANTWDAWSPDRAWVNSNDAVGCQYDWFNSRRDRTGFHWPSAAGRPDSFRDVDWDMSKVFDPSHANAAVATAASGDRDSPAYIDIFTVDRGTISYSQRTATGELLPGQCLALTIADIGPTPPPESDGFDAESAAAVSRRGSHMDLFVCGEDGYVRTMWRNPSVQFPKHPWPLNPESPARKGTPIAVVSRTLDQIDVFYVSPDHRLTTQWWNPTALDWNRNRRVLAGPVVAGGSNIVALGYPADAAGPSGLDVFYVTLNHDLAYGDPQWNASWRVVHAAWPAAGDWTFTAIPGLEAIAAGCGVASARDADRRRHVLAQTRDRSATRHAILTPRGTWQVAAGPGPIPADVTRPKWWMSMFLIVLPQSLLAVGMTSGRTLAWATWQAGRWSNVAEGAAAFASTRPLSLAARRTGDIDVMGVDELGAFHTRTLTVSRTGAVALTPPP